MNGLRIHDLDAITRNLTALDLAHLTPEEAADYELELSAIASLNKVLEISTAALKMPNHPQPLAAALPNPFRCRSAPKQPASPAA